MSYHYIAGQYNGPFKSTRLRNWSLGVNPYPGAFAGCPAPCPTQFIADDCGHLLPNVCRNGCSSPWGDYRTSIWEEPIPCCCIDQLRNPQAYKAPKPCQEPKPCSPPPCPPVCDELPTSISIELGSCDTSGHGQEPPAACEPKPCTPSQPQAAPPTPKSAKSQSQMSHSASGRRGSQCQC